MEVILDILAQILRPLSLGLIVTSILAGACLGIFYNYPLNIDPRMVYHKAVAGWVFIFFVFLYRLISNLLDATQPSVVSQFWGWAGIGILWTIFCLAIYVTDRITTEMLFRKTKARTK